MKVKNILSIILNLLLAGAAGYGVTLAFIAAGKDPFVFIYYFTLFSNILLAVVSIWGVIRSIVSLAKGEDKRCGFYALSRLAVTTSLILVLTVCLTLIRDVAFGEAIYNWILHVITPALSLLIYLFIDSDHKNGFGITFGSFLLPVIYGLYTLPLVYFQFKLWATAPYPFLDILNNPELTKNILTMAICVVGTFIVSILLWAINRGLHAAIYKNKAVELEDIATELPEVSEPEEEVKEEVKEEPAIVLAEETSKPAPKKATTKKAPAKKATSEAKVEETKETPKKAPAKKAAAPKKEETKEAPKKAPAKKDAAPKKEETKEATKKAPTKKAAPKKEETKEAPKKAPAKKVETKPEEVKPVETPTSEETKPEYRIYHVSKRADDGQWQVKFAKGQRAIKLFRTQAEAIDFAKKLAESQNGSIRVHSVKGKIRKA